MIDKVLKCSFKRSHINQFFWFQLSSVLWLITPPKNYRSSETPSTTKLAPCLQPPVNWLTSCKLPLLGSSNCLEGLKATCGVAVNLALCPLWHHQETTSRNVCLCTRRIFVISSDTCYWKKTFVSWNLNNMGPLEKTNWFKSNSKKIPKSCCLAVMYHVSMLSYF